MQKSKPKTKKPAERKTAKLLNRLKQLSVVEKLFIVACVVVAGLFMRYQIQVYVEHNTYKQAEKQIQMFIDEAAKLAPSTTETKKYCSHTSEKYGRGALVCDVTGRAVYKGISKDSFASIMSEAPNLSSAPKWVEEFTESDAEVSGSSGIIKKTVYKNDGLTCGIYYRYETLSAVSALENPNERSYLIESSCSGSALKEYYPT